MANKSLAQRGFAQGQPVEDPNALLVALSPDLSVALFHEVTQAAYHPHVANVTNFGASNMRGTLLYHHIFENLAERLSLNAREWEKREDYGVPCVVSNRQGIKIAVTTTGGPGTGRPYPYQPAAREKRAGTVRVAKVEDGLTDMFPLFKRLYGSASATERPLRFYYLVAHLDLSAHEIRLELSQPVFKRTTRGGSFSHWEDRIIIPPYSFEPEPTVSIEPAPMPEFTIRRKAASA